jgi:hypothetical protein
MERGDLDQKSRMAWQLYDVFDADVLDMVTLRELIKRCYSNQIVILD